MQCADFWPVDPVISSCIRPSIFFPTISCLSVLLLLKPISPYWLMPKLVVLVSLEDDNDDDYDDGPRTFWFDYVRDDKTSNMDDDWRAIGQVERINHWQSQLSMGPFCVTLPNPTHYKWKSLDQTRPNPILTVIGWHYHFITPSDKFPVPVRSALRSNLTAWCNQILSNRALNASK